MKISTFVSLIASVAVVFSCSVAALKSRSKRHHAASIYDVQRTAADDCDQKYFLWAPQYNLVVTIDADNLSPTSSNPMVVLARRNGHTCEDSKLQIWTYNETTGVIANPYHD